MDDIVQFNVKAKKDVKFFFKAEAKARGVTLSKLVRDAVIFYTGMTTEFQDAAREVAQNMKINEAAFLEATVINSIAQNTAFKMIFGVTGANIMRPFQWDPNGRLILGEELTTALLNEYVEIFKKFQRLIIDQLETGGPGFKVNGEVFQIGLGQTQTQKGDEHSI